MGRWDVLALSSMRDRADRFRPSQTHSETLFTIIVQNAFPSERIGQVTVTLNFFREIGGTVGLAVLGSVMTSHFQE